MTDRKQERAALALFLDSVRSMRSIELVVHRDDPGEFPDFILLNRATNQEIWVEIVPPARRSARGDPESGPPGRAHGSAVAPASQAGQGVIECNVP